MTILSHLLYPPRRHNTPPLRGSQARRHPSIHPSAQLSLAAGGLDSRLPLHVSSFTPVRGSPWNRVPSAPSSQPGSCFPLLEDQRHQITSRWLRAPRSPPPRSLEPAVPSTLLPRPFKWSEECIPLSSVSSVLGIICIVCGSAPSQSSTNVE